MTTPSTDSIVAGQYEQLSDERKQQQQQSEQQAATCKRKHVEEQKQQPASAEQQAGAATSEQESTTATPQMAGIKMESSDIKPMEEESKREAPTADIKSEFKAEERAPAAEKVEYRPSTEALTGTTWRQLTEKELPKEADDVLCWLVRYPVERNHPRPTTGTLPLTKEGDVAVALWNEPISHVLQKLIVEGFSGMPVISAGRRFVGQIDILDILWHTLITFKAWSKEAPEVNPQQLDKQSARKYWEQFMALPKWKNAKVEDIITMNVTGGKSFFPVKRGFSLYTVAEQMAHNGAYRIPILTNEGVPEGIVTQSMVVSLLDQHMKRLPTIRTNKVQQMLGGLEQHLITVNENDRAIDAFRKLAELGITGVGVINDGGILTDVLSVRDIRLIGPTCERFQDLYLTVKQYKAECRKVFPDQTPEKPITVTTNDTFETVINKMDDGNIHRVFVVDYLNNDPELPLPRHVITQRAVIRYLLYVIGAPPVVTEKHE